MRKLIDDDTLRFLSWLTRYYRFAAHAGDPQRVPVRELRALYRRRLTVAQAYTELRFIAPPAAARPN